MRLLTKGLVVAGLATLAAASTCAAMVSYGWHGSLNAVHSALSEAVSSDVPSAVKMNNWVEASTSTTLSKDFVTFSKIAKEAEKGDFDVLSEEFLANHFADMVEMSAFYGQDAFLALLEAAESNPLKVALILKSQAKYIAKEAKSIAKYNAVWGEPQDEGKISLPKAAIYYSQIQKLYEIIAKAASKYNPPV